MNIFVGNLLFDAVEADVKKLFEGFGKVDSVVIVMQKDGKKSRGFAFVEMLDEQEARAAIAALNGNEFMGRVLNVEAGRPKSESDGQDRKKRKKPVNADVEFQQQGTEPEGKEEINYNKAQFNQARPNKSGYSRYKEGRRSRGYMMRRSAAGATELAAPERKRKDNPMRWRKNSTYSSSRPWKKTSGEAGSFQKDQGERKPLGKPVGEHGPYQKNQGERRPWSKPAGEPRPFGRPSTGEHRPFRKDQGERRPWSKPAGESKSFGKPTAGEFKPWRRSEAGDRPWKRAEGEAKPWRKTEGEARPWRKTEGEAKPWRKASGDSAARQKPKGGSGFRGPRRSSGIKRSWNKS
ncbi:MAG: hypothetical protein HY761_00605 [Candidatus Omnitrophica bacterium]|nr:hypothetical protein [Candidatus Omnitrophota bacterium]